MFLALSLFIIFVARRGTPNLPVGYWRSQLLQDDSPVHGPVYITVHRKTGDENVNVLRNPTVLSAVHLFIPQFFLPIFGWDMMKNLNDISTLFKGVTYTRIMASKEEKVRKLRSRHAYVRHEMRPLQSG